MNIFFYGQSENERINLIERFKLIKHKKIFLTNRKNEEYKDETTIIKFIPNWSEKSQYDRDKSFINRWEEGLGVGIKAPIVNTYIKIINNFNK